MKLILPLIIFLVLPAYALADVSIDIGKTSYNFGDFVEISYTVSTDADFSGLTELSLMCANFEWKLHTLLTNLIAGQSETVSVPSLLVESDMVGRCFIDADVSSRGDVINYKTSSAYFNVTGDLPVSVMFEKDVIKPAEEMVISGIVNKSHSSRSYVQLSFLGELYSGPVINNSFAYTIRLPNDIKTGEHSLDFIVNDSYDNSGTVSATFIVEAVPTVLSLDIGNGSIKPGEVLEGSVDLFDQAGDKMIEDVDFYLLDRAGDVVLYASNETPADFGLKLKQSQPSGTYTAKVTSVGLTKTSLLIVEPVETVSVSFDNRTLTVVNTGNVDYTNDLVIELTGTETEFALSKEIELEPGQKTVIDLYKEVPEDDYDIVLPELSNAPSFESHLEDERSTIRKTGDFIGFTGGDLSETIAPGLKTFLSSGFIITLVFLLSVYFYKNRGNKNRGKKLETYDIKEKSEEAMPVLKEYSEEKSDESTSPTEEPTSGQTLSRDDDAVKTFMENLNKDKPFK